MKKKIISVITLFILSIMCIAMFAGCVQEEPKPRKVELELVNPITGEAIKKDEVIELPEEGTPIEIRIKDKETGRYLTDDDLPENTIENSYHVNFAILDKEGHLFLQEYYKYWPTPKDIECFQQYNYYKMVIFFDCRPENPKDPKKFYRRYERKTEYVRFYINRSWREEN